MVCCFDRAGTSIPVEPAPGARDRGQGTPAGVPSDNTTLQEVLRQLAADGWAEDLWLLEAPDVEPALVCCRHCGHRCQPEELPVDRTRRLEGASDPADMLMVLAVTCPSCRARGTLVARYGPEAGVHDDALLLLAANARNQTQGNPE